MNKTFRKVILYGVLLFFLILPYPIRAEDSLSPLNGYTLTVGVSVKQLDFNYYRSGNDLSPAGIMTEGMYFT